jgi:hypothetical protein
MNIFDKLILEGKIASLPELRRYYRALASKAHPDTSKREGSHETFIKLKKDYEQAESRLARLQDPENRRRKPSKPTREEIYHSFWDIEASGFPVDRSVRESSRAYRERIRIFSRQLGAYWARPNPAFEEIENELYEIRGDDIIDNPLFGKIRMIFYNIVSWHQNPTAFCANALEKWRGEICPELDARDLQAIKAFLSWLVDDMKNGAAL